MKSVTLTVLAALAAWAASSARAAEFAPVGAKATLSVEYRFESVGKQQDRLDLHQWRVKRSADLVAELVAAKPQPTPVLHPPEPAQIARSQQRSAAAQKAHTQMAPMMADVQALVARCGEDEKCIERETQKLGFGMAGSERLASQQKAGKALEAATRPDADRYQLWKGRSQQGSYAVEEAWHVRHADPICMSLPGQRCKHDLARKGGAPWPAGPTVAQAEFDTQRNTITLMLPLPGPFEVTETQTTDEPEGTHSDPTPKGARKGVVGLPSPPAGQTATAFVALPLMGGWRSQSGEQVWCPWARARGTARRARAAGWWCAGASPPSDRLGNSHAPRITADSAACQCCTASGSARGSKAWPMRAYEVAFGTSPARPTAAPFM